MARSKTRILLANIQMAVRVSRYSPTSQIHQFPCLVSILTILISKRSIIYYLMPKLQQTLVKAVLLIQGYGPIDAELLAELSFYEKLRREDRSTDQTEYVKKEVIKNNVLQTKRQQPFFTQERNQQLHQPTPSVTYALQRSNRPTPHKLSEKSALKKEA